MERKRERGEGVGWVHCGSGWVAVLQKSDERGGREEGGEGRGRE